MDGINQAISDAAPGETVAEVVRRQLVDAVLFGDLTAPTRLFPADLAERFGVSITPVREALARLASEGFIEAIPRHGYHVRSPTMDNTAELWTVRLALELMAGECILRRFPDEAARRLALAPLAAVQGKLAGQAARSHRGHVRLNGQFHERLVELAGNPLLATIYQGIGVRLFVGWVQRGSRAWRTRLPGEQMEHQVILEALQAGDAAAVETAMRAHLSRSLADALADLKDAQTRQNREDHNEKTRQHDHGGSARAAAVHHGRSGPRRPAGDDPDVNVSQSRRNQPARSRAG